MIHYQSLWVILASLAAVLAGEPRDCPRDSPLSCHVEGIIRDSCCVITAGRLLQTQFWDADPAIGPTDSWTIHGLWPDRCDDGYPQNCDKDREHHNITDILLRDGAEDTLQYMEKYWKPDRGSDNTFWVHEWNKHGTCINTLEPQCYRNYQDTEEVVDFFDRAVAEFKRLPTYEWLEEAGIVPSYSKSYPTREVEEILERKHGKKPTIKCKKGQLNEVWYYFNVQGSLQTGEFVPTATRQRTNCGKTLRYLPKVDRRSHKFADGLDEDKGGEDQIEL